MSKDANPAGIQASIDQIARFLRRRFRGSVDAESLESAANYGVFRAWEQFDPSRVKTGNFNSFLRMRGRQWAFQALREEGLIYPRDRVNVAHRRQPPEPVASLDAPPCGRDKEAMAWRVALCVEDTGPAAVDDQDEMDWLLACLPERHRQAIVLYFLDGLTLEETGQLLPGGAVVKSYVQKLLRQGCARLRPRALRAGIMA